MAYSGKGLKLLDDFDENDILRAVENILRESALQLEILMQKKDIAKKSCS
ncbi:unnamed protein product [marine sediment metagenome]|uniref:Uncharacterized protein n=1 Tax=marine sediment metagenome TaxID=412755 RepID=X1TWU1_9ZZZZ